MAKLFCHLLMKVNHVIVANFLVANMSFKAVRENKILAKISEFTVSEGRHHDHAGWPLRMDTLENRVKVEERLR